MSTPRHLVQKRPKRKNVNREDTLNQINQALQIAVKNTESLLNDLNNTRQA